MKFYNKYVYPVISEFLSFYFVFLLFFGFLLVPGVADAFVYCAPYFPAPDLFPWFGFVFLLLFAFVDAFVQLIYKRHIAQKHLGVNECSEQDPGGADGP